MDSAWSHENSGNYKNVADYIREAVAIDPIDLFAEMEKPQPSKLVSQTKITVDDKIPPHIPRKAKAGEKTISMPNVLARGLEDTQDFLHDALHRHYKKITPESAAVIYRAPSTLHVLAGLALQAGGTDIERTDFTPTYNRRFGINKDFTAIEIDGIFVTEKNRGCPHAGKNGEIRPTPLFKEFGTWCGTLALQSYYTYFNGVDPTEALRAKR